MSDSTKALAGLVAGCAALVAIFALMADCSKTVATVNAEGARCVAAGGEWRPMSAPEHGGGMCIEGAAK